MAAQGVRRGAARRRLDQVWKRAGSAGRLGRSASMAGVVPVRLSGRRTRAPEDLRTRHRRAGRPRGRMGGLAAPCGGLSLGLIRHRSLPYIGGRVRAFMRVRDRRDSGRTQCPGPENRKVGGSTPPLATTTTSGNRPAQRRAARVQ